MTREASDCNAPTSSASRRLRWEHRRGLGVDGRELFGDLFDFPDESRVVHRLGELLKERLIAQLASR